MAWPIPHPRGWFQGCLWTPGSLPRRDSIGRLVANPGCYPTAVQLGFFPLVRAGLVDVDHLIADAKSGTVSGAGRKAETHILFSDGLQIISGLWVPGIGICLEIRQGLGQMAGKPVGLTFVPHLTPQIRGITPRSTHGSPREADFRGIFEGCYAAEPFVDVLPTKVPSGPARSVRPTSAGCRSSPAGRRYPGDPLGHRQPGQGAAGQAVQNMNLMFGFEETLGLCRPRCYPEDRAISTALPESLPG